MKTILIQMLLFISIGQVVRSQPNETNLKPAKSWRAIYLKKVYNEHGNPRNDLKIVNESDKRFIGIGYSEDMGAKYGTHYFFISAIPDGTYRVYIDSLLSSEDTYVNGKQHGYSSSSGPSGYLTELLYDHGTLVDVSRTTFPNGNLQNKIYYSNGFPQLTIIFYPNNKPDRHWFHVGYKTIRVDLFSEKGYLYEVKEGEEDPKKSTKYKSSDKYKLNGKHEYHCTEGHFTVHYSDNNIVDWKWTSK